MKPFLLSVLCASMCLAQSFRTAVVITNERGNPSLRAVERNLSELLTEMTRAFEARGPIRIPVGTATEQGAGSITATWNVRAYRPNGTELYVPMIRRPDGLYEVRGIPLLQFDDDQKEAYLEGVFVINGQGVLEQLRFGVEEQEYKQLMHNGLDVKETSRRLQILDFIETFRTAYTLKDADYIENVFSEKALIIVGRVLNAREPQITLRNNVEESRYRLVTYSKQQYVKNLRSTFKKNGYIKVAFDSIEVAQHRLNQRIYGVSLIQWWKSTSYSDRGYLFLVVDFKDENRPIIHVRAWEPTNAVSQNDRIALGDFDLER